MPGGWVGKEGSSFANMVKVAYNIEINLKVNFRVTKVAIITGLSFLKAGNHIF